jgi:Family of unknown function (DUF5681)
MPFAKGQSGNPAGRPVGSRNKFTREMDEALEQRGLPVVEAIIHHAQEANPAAMRLCLDRLAGKHRSCPIELPPVEQPDYIVAALTEVQRALGAGEIMIDEASRLVDLIARTGRVLAAKALAEINFAARLARCEAALALDPGEPAAGHESMPSEGPAPAPQAPEKPSIDNNNAKTMTGAAKTGATAAVTPPPITKKEDPPLDPRVAAALDKAVQDSLADVRPRRSSVKQQLMNSVNPTTLLIADITENVLAGKTKPVMPPRMPVATAA